MKKAVPWCANDQRVKPNVQPYKKSLKQSCALVKQNLHLLHLYHFEIFLKILEI